VTLRVYANGQFRDVTMKVARAGDLPRSRFGRFGGEWYFPGMPAIAPMPPMAPSFSVPAMPPIPPSPRVQSFRSISPIDFNFEWDPALSERLDEVRMQLERVRPEIEKIGTEIPRVLEKVVPDVRVRMGGGISL
jgi:hypothetical protein